MPAYTPTTITDPDLLVAHLEVIRKQGYAIDEGEQEIGVRCFAVAVPDAPAPLAISTSGPQARMTDDAAARIVPALKLAALRDVRHHRRRRRRLALFDGPGARSP